MRLIDNDNNYHSLSMQIERLRRNAIWKLGRKLKTSHIEKDFKVVHEYTKLIHLTAEDEIQNGVDGVMEIYNSINELKYMTTKIICKPL